MNWKKSLLLTCQILGLLVHTLAANGKNPLPNREILMMPIQMQLTQKQKTFSEFFAEFLKSRLNFEHFEDKADPHKFWISEITDSENMVRYISKKSRFRGCFDKQHCKRAQALLKSASQNLYQIHCSLPMHLSWKKSPFLICQILGLLLNMLAAHD